MKKKEEKKKKKLDTEVEGGRLSHLNMEAVKQVYTKYCFFNVGIPLVCIFHRLSITQHIKQFLDCPSPQSCFYFDS